MREQREREREREQREDREREQREITEKKTKRKEKKVFCYDSVKFAFFFWFCRCCVFNYFAEMKRGFSCVEEESNKRARANEMIYYTPIFLRETDSCVA